MNMQKRRWLIWLMTWVLLIMYSYPVMASDSITNAPKRTVKIGMTQIDGFSELDSEGNRSGFLYDYFSEISKYANWKLVFVEAEMEETISALAAGDVDIVGGINRDESTQELFDFPEMSSGYVYTCIITKAVNKEYIAHDYDTFQGIRIGVYSKAKVRRDALDKFCKNNNLNFKIILYDNYDDYEKSMEQGQVDALLTLNLNLRQDEKILARFDPKPHYFAVAKGKSDIVRELNQALEMIDTFEPDFARKINSTYFDYNRATAEFSKAEQKFMQDTRTVDVVCMTDWKPFSYYNEKEKRFRGISIDVLEEIGKLSGIEFNYIGVNNFKSAVEMLRSDEADLFCGVFNAEYMRDEYGLFQSLPYIRTQTVVASRDGRGMGESHMSDRQAALTYGFKKPLSFAQAGVQYYDTTDESLNTVRKGNADYALVSSLAMESYIRRNGSGGLITTPVADNMTELAFAYSPEVSSYLVSIMDKSIFALSQSDMYSLILGNVISDSPVSLNSYIYANPYQIIMVLAAFSVLIVLIVYLFMKMRMRILKQNAQIGDVYRMVSDIAKEYMFEYSFEEQQLTLPAEFCQMTGFSPVQKKESCEPGLEVLFKYFDGTQIDAYANLEFECTPANGEREFFRATCTVMFDDRDRPVKGIGKITSFREEVLEKRRLELKANTDGLTGFYLKSHFIALADEYLRNVPRGELTALLMIDLDYFKEVNDTLGHLGGDEVLKFLADCIKKNQMGSMICGRFGGDEFFLLIKDVPDKEQLDEWLGKFCKDFERIFHFDGKEKKISISIGAVCREGYGQNCTELLRAADRALYQKKMKGRNGHMLTD